MIEIAIYAKKKKKKKKKKSDAFLSIPADRPWAGYRPPGGILYTNEYLVLSTKLKMVNIPL